MTTGPTPPMSAEDRERAVSMFIADGMTREDAEARVDKAAQLAKDNPTTVQTVEDQPKVGA